MRTAFGVLSEAAASARSQPAASLLTLIMVAGMCVAALLTTGRTVAAEDAVLAEIDAVGTRGIVVRADEQAGVTTAILDQLDRVTAVGAVTGFGPLTDARNSQVDGGTLVPIREAYGQIGDVMLTDGEPRARAVASTMAAERLGLIDGTGSITTTASEEYVVAGSLDVPEHLAFLEPLVVVPSSMPGAGESVPLTVLVILVDQPQDVAAVTDVVTGLLAGADPQSVTIETSEQLADIRAAIGGELGSYGRATVLGILAISAALVAVNLLGLVILRRRDFGRRRALGATQGLIVGLLLAQTLLLALIGAGIGTASTLAWLSANGQPVPDPDFSIAVATAAVLTAGLAALIPAAVAARRDPLHELRVP